MRSVQGTKNDTFLSFSTLGIVDYHHNKTITPRLKTTHSLKTRIFEFQKKKKNQNTIIKEFWVSLDNTSFL